MTSFPKSGAMTRREALALTTAAAVGSRWPFGEPSDVQAQEAAATSLAPLNRFPRMVQEFFVQQVRQAERRGLERKAALKTQADAEAYVLEVQKKIRVCLRPRTGTHAAQCPRDRCCGSGRISDRKGHFRESPGFPRHGQFVCAPRDESSRCPASSDRVDIRRTARRRKRTNRSRKDSLGWDTWC